MESIPDLSELRKRGSLIQDGKRKGSFPWPTGSFLGKPTCRRGRQGSGLDIPVSRD